MDEERAQQRPFFVILCNDFCPNLMFYTHIWTKIVQFLSKSHVLYPHLDKNRFFIQKHFVVLPPKQNLSEIWTISLDATANVKN